MKKTSILISLVFAMITFLSSCHKKSDDPAPTNQNPIDSVIIDTVKTTGVDDGKYFSTRTSYLYERTDSLTLQNVPLYYNTTVNAFKPSVVIGSLHFFFPNTKSEFEKFIKDSVNVNIINLDAITIRVKNGSILYDDNQHKTLKINSIITKVTKINDLNYIVEGRSTNELTNPKDKSVKFTSQLHYRIKITLK